MLDPASSQEVKDAIDANVDQITTVYSKLIISNLKIFFNL